MGKRAVISPEFYEAWHEHISITERPYGREAPAGGGGGSGGMVAHDLVNGWQAAA